ncbi:unnamed protein product [Rotaria sp. Silwood1]|nr:unnamed protein product [Rotaria sp. Silwood1]CAF4861134.1 unnamed protein product [Rotaria sp. Silwood1]
MKYFSRPFLALVLFTFAMSSILCSNINTASSKDRKYHIILIYLVHDDWYYGGGYYESFSKLMGAVGGETQQKMLDDVYESLEESMEDKDCIPFDMKNIK